MKEQLKNITKILTGVYAKPSEHPDVVSVNVRDLDQFGNLSSELIPTVSSGTLSEQQFLQTGDVLLSSRNVFKAIVYHAEYQKAVASNSFLILRLHPKDRNVTPDYLSWYLNHPKTNRLIEHLAQGSTRVPYLSKKKAAELEIPILPISKQEQIVQFNELAKKETELLRLISNKKNRLHQEVMYQTILTNKE